MYGAFLSERSKHLSKKTPQVWPIRFSEHVIFTKVLLEKCNVDEMLENGHLHVFKFPNLTKIFLINFTAILKLQGVVRLGSLPNFSWESYSINNYKSTSNAVYLTPMTLNHFVIR